MEIRGFEALKNLYATLTDTAIDYGCTSTAASSEATTTSNVDIDNAGIFNHSATVNGQKITGGAWDIQKLSDNYLLVKHAMQTDIVDVSNPSCPTTVTSYKTFCGVGIQVLTNPAGQASAVTFTDEGRNITVFNISNGKTAFFSATSDEVRRVTGVVSTSTSWYVEMANYDRARNSDNTLPRDPEAKTRVLYKASDGQPLATFKGPYKLTVTTSDTRVVVRQSHVGVFTVSTRVFDNDHEIKLNTMGQIRSVTLTPDGYTATIFRPLKEGTTEQALYEKRIALEGRIDALHRLIRGHKEEIKNLEWARKSNPSDPRNRVLNAHWYIQDEQNGIDYKNSQIKSAQRELAGLNATLLAASGKLSVSFNRAGNVI